MPQMTSEQRRVFWQDRIDRCQRSPLTIERFCKQEHCTPGSFYYWKRLLSEPHRPASKMSCNDSIPTRNGSESQLQTERFIPIVTRDVAPSVQLRLPGGAWFDLPAQFDPQQLRTLVSATIDATCHVASLGDNS